MKSLRLYWTCPDKKMSRLLITLTLACAALLNAEDHKTTNQPTQLPVIEVSLNTDFTSVDQFVESLQVLNPSKTKNGIADLFSAIQVGQPELNDTGTRIYPDKIQSVKVLFQSDKEAVVFAEAFPQTEAASSCVGALISLSCDNGMKKWRILDIQRFYTFGKHAGISAKVTSDVGTGYSQALHDLVISVKINEGGRSKSSSTTGSFRVSRWGKLSQIPLL